MQSPEYVICSRVRVTDYFHLLLTAEGVCGGFVLNNATRHMGSQPSYPDNEKFESCFKKMLRICQKKAYDAMGEKDMRYLHLLDEIETECLKIKDEDDRISDILDFVKNSKFTFYG